MKKSVHFISLLVMLSVFAVPVVAQQIIPVDQWTVKPGGGKNSDLNQQGIILRQYSPVYSMPIDREVTVVSMNYHLFGPASVQIVITLAVTYDDGAIEKIRSFIPQGKTDVKMEEPLKWFKGRIVKQLEFTHGHTATDVRVNEVSVKVKPSEAVYIDQSILGGATLHADKNRRNRVILVNWDDNENTSPFLTQIPSGDILLVVAKNATYLDEKSRLDVQLRDKNGSTFKTLGFDIDGNVQPVAINIESSDLTRLGKLIFKTRGGGNHLNIRQIIIGGKPSTGSSPCGDHLRPVNEKFNNLIEEWKRSGTLGPNYIKELENLMTLYRNME